MLNNTLGLIFLNGKLSFNNNNNKICNKKTVGEEGRISEEDHIPIITIILQMFCQQAIYFLKKMHPGLEKGRLFLMLLYRRMKTIFFYPFI